MKEFITGCIMGLIAGISNVLFFGSLFYLWGLKDPDGFGGVIGVLFTSPFLIGMIIFMIFSKCRPWVFLSIIVWILYAYLIAADHNRIAIGIAQLLLLFIPISLGIIAFVNRRLVFKV